MPRSILVNNKMSLRSEYLFLLEVKGDFMNLLPGYEYFWVFLVIAILVPFLAFNISNLVAPSSKSPEKRTTYESGIEPMGESWIQFQIRYYMFALVFVVFDVETVFLYPWAISFSELGIIAFIEAIVFIMILIIGLIYAWRKGALEWS
jgi:NAD(P)H-quinone oxidoreductase subunit 3